MERLMKIECGDNEEFVDYFLSLNAWKYTPAGNARVLKVNNIDSLKYITKCQVVKATLWDRIQYVKEHGNEN
ncbi:hypothetical protein HPMBJEAJ_00082 [Aeromonas phage avDM6]|nr:hypothetical protein HPMBJEAJ_00082 [Aeromonas phage avDM6]